MSALNNSLYLSTRAIRLTSAKGILYLSRP